MAPDDIYERLRLKLSQWPVKMPASPRITSILKMLFTTEEVELLLSDSFSAPYKDQKTIEQVSSEQNLSVEYVKKIMDSLVTKGLLFRFHHNKSNKIYYSLLPVLPGFFEFYLVGEPSEDVRNKFSRLFEDYYKEKLVEELSTSSYPWVRVLPAEKNLEVNIDLDPTVEILTFERVSDYISTSRKVALMKCACRIKDPCDHPEETCLCFDYYADYMVERGLATYLSLEDAEDKLKQFEDAGLVHTTTNCQKKPQFICNCCTCSCLVLRGLSEFNNPGLFSRSNFHPQWVADDCSFCEVCMEICPVNAIRLTATLTPEEREYGEDRLVFDTERCIGCGLCASNCTPDAIRMLKVRDDVPESTLKGMWMRAELERGAK